jgi:cell division protein ZapA
MKQMEFTILGQGYILGCEDGGEALLKAAVESVDREMSTIRDAGKVKARERIAVLAALNLAYQLAAKPPEAAPHNEFADTAPDAFDPDEINGLVKRLDAALGADGHLL